MSITEDEIEIGGQRYVNAWRLASMLGVSVRTLSRWDAAGTGPPKIKVGRKASSNERSLATSLCKPMVPRCSV